MTDEQTPAPPPERRGMHPATVVRLVLALLVIAIVVIFVAQNSDRVELEFLGWSFRTPQFIMMLGSGLAGIVVWEAFLALGRRSRSKRATQS